MSFYEHCGVSIKRAELICAMLKEHVENLGGFAATLPLDLKRQDQHLLLSVDGVGSKVDLALNRGNWALRGIGVDLVAMNVNDIVAQGGTPIAFMDYIATDKIDSEKLDPLIQGISSACEQSNVIFAGGETAEMPEHKGMGLAGFAVGTAKDSKLMAPNLVTSGDVVIGLCSSGFHANGYAAINALAGEIPKELMGHFLTPTHLYVKVIRALREKVPVSGMAHITGGGLNNIARCLPKYHKAVLNENAYYPAPEMLWFQDKTGIDMREMMATFNCGWGFVVVVDREWANDTLNLLEDFPCGAGVIGRIEKHNGKPIVEMGGG